MLDHSKPAITPPPPVKSRLPIVAAALALMMLIGLPEARAKPFGQCARQRNVDAKIASCLEAARSTSYARILHWVHAELARAYRQRVENEKATTSYSRELAAGARMQRRQETEELGPLPRPM